MSPVAAFPLPRQYCVAAAEAMQPAKSSGCNTGAFAEKTCHPAPRFPGTSHEQWLQSPHSPHTFLAVAVSPTPLDKLPVNDRGRAAGLALRSAWTDVPTFLVVVFVQHNVIILHGVQDARPVDGGQVAELIVLLDADSPPGDVHQAVEAQLLQVNHLKDDQRVVEEETGAPDDREVGEQVLQALQPVDPEQQQVVSDHDEFGETEVSEILRPRLEHQQNLQMSFNDRAVGQLVQPREVVPDVHAGTHYE